MKLHEINEAIESGQSVRTDLIILYKRSLLTLWGKDAILVVTDVFNACSYAQIVNPDGFSELIDDYVNSIPDLNENEREHEKELINIHSIPLCKL
jgi:hypothetical protein